MENKDGFVVAIAGGTGSGKTTYTKKIISVFKGKKPFFIYDIDAEYLEFYRAPYVPLKEFYNKVIKLKNSVIVFEEAKLFFGHANADSDLLEMIITARRRGNIIIFNFHQLRQIPIHILGYTNFLVVKKTVMDTVERFNENGMYEVVKAYEEAKQSKDFYFTKSINLRPRVT